MKNRNFRNRNFIYRMLFKDLLTVFTVFFIFFLYCLYLCRCVLSFLFLINGYMNMIWINTKHKRAIEHAWSCKTCVRCLLNVGSHDHTITKFGRPFHAIMQKKWQNYTEIPVRPKSLHFEPVELYVRSFALVDAVAVSIVFGVPTIKRERESYLSRTLQSLIDSLSDDDRMDCLIVVMICEVRRVFRYVLWLPLHTQGHENMFYSYFCSAYDLRSPMADYQKTCHMIGNGCSFK